ncbi:hypothetical protein KHP57_23845, partial [Algiphilus sp. NNCM1]|nr:hypothetical protein [Algiphilus acroporae]
MEESALFFNGSSLGIAIRRYGVSSILVGFLHCVFSEERSGSWQCHRKGRVLFGYSICRVLFGNGGIIGDIGLVGGWDLSIAETMGLIRSPHLCVYCADYLARCFRIHCLFISRF